MQEGMENEKLLHHPTDVKSYWAYRVIHHPAYYIVEFVVCLLLMLLAFLERPLFFDAHIRVSVVPISVRMYVAADTMAHT